MGFKHFRRGIREDKFDNPEKGIENVEGHLNDKEEKDDDFDEKIRNAGLQFTAHELKGITK